MTTLGTYPSHRYSRSWMVQRFMNKLPIWAQARKSPTSVAQQLTNPIALDIQETIQQLASERYNLFVSTCSIHELDRLYKVDLPEGITFNYTEDSSGIPIYTPPTVHATINNTEYQITQAEDNNIKTLAHDNLPSRIEEAEIAYSYLEVIPETTIANLDTVTINNLTIASYLYITIKDNSNWEERTANKVFFPKVYITGTTRKGITQTEAVPIRYNGTFKTLNEWSSVDSVYVSYLDSTATICIEIFPWNREFYLDTQNICVPWDAEERIQFTRLNSREIGSTFVAETFTLANLDLVRATNMFDKEIFYEIQLLDNESNSLTLLDFVHRPNSRFIYAIDTTNLYVYDISLPFPDVLDLINESPEAIMDLYTDRWILTQNEETIIQTRNLDITNVPYQFRWHLLDPDDEEYYVGVDGSLWPTTTSGWISNDLYDYSNWQDQRLELTPTKTGRYILSIECQYFNESTNETKTLTSKLLLWVPAITPEIQLPLPENLAGATNIAYDSDGDLWLLKDDEINKLNMFFDYFLVDYETNRIWLKEEYPSIRIVL